jgi:hypothetical protein
MLKQTIPYKLRKLAIIAAAPFLMQACDKDDEPYTGPLHDTTYTFNQDYFPQMGQIKASADSASVRKVILLPTGRWGNIDAINVSFMIDNFLDPATKISPKVTGGGKFVGISSNNASTKSLEFFTKNGWDYER